MLKRFQEIHLSIQQLFDLRDPLLLLFYTTGLQEDVGRARRVFVLQDESERFTRNFGLQYHLVYLKSENLFVYDQADAYPTLLSVTPYQVGTVLITPLTAMCNLNTYVGFENSFLGNMQSAMINDCSNKNTRRSFPLKTCEDGLSLTNNVP